MQASPPPPPEPPIELCPSVLDVLHRCRLSLSPNHNATFLSKLASLPNLRRPEYQPPSTTHTPWRILSKEDLYTAPSLNTLLSTIETKITPLELSRSQVTKDRELQSTPLSIPELQSLTHEIQSNKGQLRTRLTGLPCEKFVSPQVANESKSAVQRLVRTHYGEDSVAPEDLLATIVPKGCLGEVMCEPTPCLSVFQGREIDARAGRPVDLWFVWPSMENHKMGSCYGDTAKALETLSHGAFVVLMAGEGLLLPAHAPCSTFAVSSNVNVSRSFWLEGTVDPSAVALDAMLGEREGACEEWLMKFKEGLKDRKWRERYVDHLLETWSQTYMVMSPEVCGTECRRKCREHSKKDYRRRMLKILVADMRREKKCAFCVSSGIGSLGILDEPDFSKTGSLVQHVKKHGWMVLN